MYCTYPTTYIFHQLTVHTLYTARILSNWVDVGIFRILAAPTFYSAMLAMCVEMKFTVFLHFNFDIDTDNCSRHRH